MNPNLQYEVLKRLESDFNFKERGNNLRQGTCPDCGKKELYSFVDSPWVVRCGRLNKCGAVIHIKELYPDLFESYSDRYQATSEDPNASAREYLQQARGLDVSQLAGMYKQDSFYDVTQGYGTATVRFLIKEGVYWERFIDNVHKYHRKAHFIGAYRGHWWHNPNVDLINTKEIWIVEGIFDAAALNERGISAVSIMTCGNYPSESLKWLDEQRKERPTLIIALDNDNAGKKFTRKLAEQFEAQGWTVKAAQPPYAKKKLDWNDLHQLDRLQDKDIENYRYYGDLVMAKSASQKALIMYSRKARNEFLFDFDNRLFNFKVDVDKYTKTFNILESDESLEHDEIKEKALQESGAVVEISNCLPTPLYYQANEITDESWYYFKVSFPSGLVVKNTFTGGQLSSASEFKKRLLHIAKGGLYTGNSHNLDRLMLNKLPRIKTVNTVDFIGYSSKYQAYIFNQCAVSNGRIYSLNEEDFFEINKLNIKTLAQSAPFEINLDAKNYHDKWLPLIHQAYGCKGLIVMAFWFGSLFAEQIRAKDKSFPFLEIVGDPGTGKSTLIEFMWKLFGRENYEGFDPSKATLPARSRNFAQVSNMPVVLIEGDREGNKNKGFDWEETKPLYNGRSTRSRGLKTSGNETYEPPFRGSIVIAQNAPVDATPAVLERIMQIHTYKKDLSENSKQAAEKLEAMPMEAVSHFIIKSTLNEHKILDTYHLQFSHYKQLLANTKDIHHIRLIKNHAQLLALLDALALVVNIPNDWIISTQEEVIRMVKTRQNAVTADHPSVAEFWEIFEFLDTNTCDVNHSSDPHTIAINLNQFAMVASDWRQNLAPISELKKLLKNSVSHKFIDIKNVRSACNTTFNLQTNSSKRPETLKCWVFKRGK